jgi:hypothetical protein
LSPSLPHHFPRRFSHPVLDPDASLHQSIRRLKAALSQPPITDAGKLCRTMLLQHRRSHHRAAARGLQSSPPSQAAFTHLHRSTAHAVYSSTIDEPKLSQICRSEKKRREDEN